MTASYLGPYSGVTNGAAGWANHCTGAGTFKPRYDDGDPVASLLWREFAGNVNFQLAQSAREVWTDAFVGSGAAATDPTYVNIATAWDVAAVYAFTPAIIVTPNARRGPGHPPRLACRVRARTNGAGTATVRVYSVATFAEVQAFDGTNTKRTTDIAVTSATYPSDANEGFLPTGGNGNAVSLTLATSRLALVHPVYGADLEVGMDVLVTHLILAGIGDAANGPLVAAIEVFEEAPAV